MADEHTPEDEMLDLTDEQRIDDEPEQQDEPEEFHLELEGEEAPTDEPGWAKELRQRNRDMARELDGYRKQTAPKKVEVGARPTLDGCDYDEDRFATELEAWNDRKRQNERVETDAQEQERVRNEQFQRATRSYEAAKAKLPVKDYDKAEETVRNAVSPILAAAIVQYFRSDAPKVVATLAQYPAMLEKVSAEPDTIEALMTLKEMQGKIRSKTDVTRKPPPPPEAATIQRGSGSMAPINPDKKLKKLEEDARRTGNRTELIAYKVQLENQEKKK